MGAFFVTQGHMGVFAILWEFASLVAACKLCFILYIYVDLNYIEMILFSVVTLAKEFVIHSGYNLSSEKSDGRKLYIRTFGC